MPRTHKNNPLATTPVFPGAIHTPAPWLNAPDATDGPYPPVTETFTVPLLADSTGRHRVELDHAITAAADLTVTIGATTLTLVPANLAPSATECAVNLAGAPVLEFHPSHAGATGTATYTPAGTVATADRLNQLEQEIAAAQAAIQAGNVLTVGPGPGAQYETLADALTAVAAMDRAADEWVIVRVLPGEYEGHTSWTQPRCVIVSVAGAACTTLSHTSIAETDPAPTPQKCAINILTSNVVLRGFTIHNKADAFPNAAIALGIGYTTTTMTLAGIRVSDCAISNVSGRDPIFAGGANVTFSASSRVVIERCEITGSSDVVSLVGNVTLRNSTITVTAMSGPATWIAGRDGELTELSDVVVSGLDPICINATSGETHAVNVVSTVPGSAFAACLRGESDPLPAPTIYHSGCAAGNGGVASDTLSALTLVPLERAGRVPHLMPGSGYNDEPLVRVGSGTAAINVVDHPVDSTVVLYPNAGMALHATHYRGASTFDADETILAGLNARIPASTLTAKGSILTATSGSAPAELPVPSTAGPWILRPASGAATGLEWVQRGVVWQTLADSATLNGSVSTEQYFSDTYTIPANALVAGSVWRVVFEGATKGTGTGETFTGKVYLGSTAILNTGARSTQNTNFGGGLQLQAMLVVRSAGAAGAIVVSGLGGYIVYWYGNTPVPTTHTINTTGTLVLKASAQWSGTNASNEAKLLSARLERLA